jgi:hypothetical protein
VAKGFIAEFLVKVSSLGAPKVKKDIESVAQTVDRVAAAHANAGKSTKDLYSTMEKGVIGTANSTKSFSKMAQTIGGSGGTSLVGVYATLAANVFAVSAAFNALRSAAQLQQVLNGLDAAGNRVGLTLSVATRRVQELAGGMLTAEQAARSTAQFMSGGFKTKDLERFTILSRDISVALGRNMTDTMDRLTRGVLKLEPELLDELGIMTKLTDATTAYAASHHKSAASLTQFERRLAFTTAVAAEGELKFSGLAESAGNTTAYDRLSATFANLTKDFFGFINGPLGAFISKIADSKIALVGFITLFASSIKGQLLPMFNNLGERGAVVGKQLAKVSFEKAASLAETLDARDSDLQEYYAKVDAGTAKHSDFQSIYAETQADIEKRQQQTADRKSKRYTKEMRDFDNYTDHLVEQQGYLKQFGSETLRSTAYSTSGNAINLASTGNFKLALDERTASFKTFDEAAKLSNGTITKWNTTVFRATTNLRMLGAAFLYALPYIGIFIAVFGTLYAILTKVSPEQKKMNDAFRDLGETAENTKKILVEYNSTLEKSGPLALKTAQAITIKSNSIGELVGRYGEAMAAMEEYARAQELEKKNTETFHMDKGQLAAWQKFGKGFFTSFINIPEGHKQMMEALNDEKLIKNFSDAGIKAGSAFGKSFGSLAMGNDNQKEVAKTLGMMNQWDPRKMGASMMKYDKQLKAAANDQTELMKIGLLVAQDFGNGWIGAAEAVKSFQEAAKGASDALGSFLRASAQTTPYDDVVKKMDTLSQSMSDLESLGAAAGKDQWKDLLSGLNSDMTQFMSVTTKSSLEQLTQANALIDAYEQQKKVRGDMSGFNREDIRNSRILIDNRKETLNTAKNEIEILKQRFINAQEIERSSKNQLALEQARAAASSHINSITAEGLEQQLKKENQMKEMQVAAIEAQKAILQTVLANIEATMAQTSAQEMHNKELRKGLVMQRLTTLELGLQAAASIKDTLAGNKGPELQAQQKAQANWNTAEKVDARVTLIEAEQEQKKKELEGLDKDLNINKDRRDVLASIKTLSTQIATIRASELTAAEIAAKVDERRVEILQGVIDSLNQTKQIWNSIGLDNLKINRLLSGRQETLADELDTLRETQKAQKETIKNEDLSARNKLEAESKVAMAEIAAGKATAKVAATVTDHYDQQYEILEEQTRARYEQLDVATQLQIIEKLVFDTHKQGLEWQKDGLDYLKQELDASTALQKSTDDILKTRKEIYKKISGSTNQAGFKAADEIEAASKAYKLAKEEYGLRKSMILLEFALLDEQRRQLIENLKTRRQEMLDARSPEGNPVWAESDTEIQQLTRSLQDLMKFDPVKVKAMQVAGLDASVEQARQNSILASTPEGRGNDMLNFLASARAESEARKKAYDQDRQTSLSPVSSKAPVEDNGQRSAQNKQAQEDFRAAQARSKDFVGAIDRLIAKIDEQIKAITAQTANVPANSGTVGALSTRGNLSPRASQAMQFFINKGKSVMDAAAAVGNLMQESGPGLDQLSNGDGIAQWNDDRKNTFKRMMGKSFADSNFEEQLEFMWRESTETFWKRAWVAVSKANTVADKTVAFERGYEVAGKPNIERRKAYAQQAYAAFSGTTAAQNVPTVSESAKEHAKENAVALGPIIKEAFRNPKGNPQNNPSEPYYTEDPKPTAQTGKNDKPSTSIPAETSEPPKALPTLEEIAAEEDLKRYRDQIAQTNEIIKMATEATAALRTENEKLGAAGAMVNAMFSGMTDMASVLSVNLNTLTAAHSTINERIIAGAEIATSALTTVSSVTAQASQARIDLVDREIAAEQRRDGKSAESLAKIQSLEKRKDTIAKKAFNMQKKLAMAQTIVNTAAGVAAALVGPPGPPWSFVIAGITAAMGAAQLATIAGTSYQSTAMPASQAPSAPTTLSIGKQGDSVDLAKSNPNAGGEIGYLRGVQGQGTNASNFRTIGSAYGGHLPRGYGNTGFWVGEHGPERIDPIVPVSVSPANNNQPTQNMNASINIHAIDAKGVEEVLYGQRGNIIGMLREAANANGHTFMEDVNTSVYTKPNVSRL